MVALAHVRREPLKATKADGANIPDYWRKRSDTAIARLACAMANIEAITVRYEALAAGGMHGDLPGNGQETESTDSLYL